MRPLLAGSMRAGGSEPCKIWQCTKFTEGEDGEGKKLLFLTRTGRKAKQKKEKEEMVPGQASRKNQSMTAGLFLLLGRDSVDSENLLIVVVEAGQELEGPPGRRLHCVRVLIVGR